VLSEDLSEGRKKAEVNIRQMEIDDIGPVYIWGRSSSPAKNSPFSTVPEMPMK
jgi:hypothetical protein